MDRFEIQIMRLIYAETHRIELEFNEKLSELNSKLLNLEARLCKLMQMQYDQNTEIGIAQNSIQRIP